MVLLKNKSFALILLLVFLSSYCESQKLLILMIDGFRWDYYEMFKEKLPGLSQFIAEGVRTEWVEPIFPSLTFPSVTTIATGVFPENHGIIGNYMLDRGDENRTEAEFLLMNTTTTSDPRWWKNAEPIWITASKNNHKVYLAKGRCDVTFDGVSPAQCTPYKYIDVSTQLRENLRTSLQRLSQDFSCAFVYDDLLDDAGHAFGPDSYEAKMALMSIDSVLREFEFNLRTSSIANKLNMIIVSDHGMTNIKKDTSVKYILLGDYINIDNVYKIVDYGALCSIAAIQTPNAISELHDELQTLPGIDVYKKEDIPEEFHYKKHPFVLDFLLVARQGYAIVGIQGEKQIPNNSKASEVQPYLGNHGYYNITDMKTIFFARGPAFKKGWLHSPIGIEDEYQIFTKILDIPPRSNNGSWERVAGMFS